MKKQEILLLRGSNIWYFGEGLFGPLIAVFAGRIGGDILDISWAWATYLIVGGMLYIVMGRLVDRHHIKARVVVLGYALNAIFTFGYLFVSSIPQLLIVQAGLGVAAAFMWPSWAALYSEYEDKDQDAYEWGLADGEALILNGIAIIIGGFIVSSFSFQALFIIMGIIQTLGFLWMTRILKTVKR